MSIVVDLDCPYNFTFSFRSNVYETASLSHVLLNRNVFYSILSADDHFLSNLLWIVSSPRWMVRLVLLECLSSPGGLGILKRHRNCSNPYPLRYGDHCFGDALEYRNCGQKLCDDGVWGNWERWGTCSSLSCGIGVHQRSRSCANKIGTTCKGRSFEVKLCKQQDCCKFYERLVSEL
ncbi:ectin-like [Ruditapes philippinarum]|uniref:ectin-like n=1 Tax=Ruditapes philippinarum TaxID=129788 RepID=UPI00295BFB20|nr:ectin-like [Ruditapes philippinarum]